MSPRSDLPKNDGQVLSISSLLALSALSFSSCSEPGTPLAETDPYSVFSDTTRTVASEKLRSILYETPNPNAIAVTNIGEYESALAPVRKWVKEHPAPFAAATTGKLEKDLETAKARKEALDIGANRLFAARHDSLNTEAGFFLVSDRIIDLANWNSRAEIALVDTLTTDSSSTGTPKDDYRRKTYAEAEKWMARVQTSYAELDADLESLSLDHEHIAQFVTMQHQHDRLHSSLHEIRTLKLRTIIAGHCERSEMERLQATLMEIAPFEAETDWLATPSDSLAYEGALKEFGNLLTPEASRVKEARAVRALSNLEAPLNSALATLNAKIVDELKMADEWRVNSKFKVNVSEPEGCRIAYFPGSAITGVYLRDHNWAQPYGLNIGPVRLYPVSVDD